MPATKQYGPAPIYEKKLARVMERFGVPMGKFNFNWDRHSAWVEFFYKGQLYRFEHSVLKAATRNQNLEYGSDCFAQLVMALEDLARMVERGIYDLQTWIVGLRALPEAKGIPECFKALGFTEVPSDIETVKARFKQLAKVVHPDAGGNPGEFERVKAAADQAEALLRGADKP